MIDSKYFEIPDFCELTRQCEPNCPCNSCLSIFNNCGPVFGTTTTPVSRIPTCECHDICVEEVVLIGNSGEFTKCIAYPPVGPCRVKCNGTFNFPTLTVGETCQVILWCADEQIDEGCQSITVRIGLVLICGNCTTNPIILPLPTFTKTFTTFYGFPDCIPVTGQQLKNELTRIDGSCLVAQFNAVVTTPQQITISGKIIDKLWRSENLWIEGIRPFELSDQAIANGFSSFTVKGSFDSSHQIGPCTDICPQG
ncbi:hypothetical protein [Pelosinus fermentans]|uniref:Uncharacterized protein n=1 Tax=Pelosinus fermentans JBW45 TaxID=1192197 RepID=I9DCP5_9FIRM|nr:hypothetical protein [Pelosinus fermentans]AJQ27111.1 hypothetical protein JBW_01761 [Pelosinus fermentans JBW45]